MEIVYWIILLLIVFFIGWKLYKEIKQDIENRDKKKLYQWLGIAILCIVTFTLVRTVFYQPLCNILGIKDSNIVSENISTDDLFKSLDE